MSWDGEHYHMIELGPEAVEQRITEAREVLSFAERLTLLPAEAPGEINDQAKHLFSDLDSASLDTILAAWGGDRILLCDDLPFRMLAAEIAPIKAIWTQPAVAFGISVGRLPTEKHFRVGNALVEAGYFFTTINSGNFLHALKESGWDVNSTIRALIDLLARPANVPQRVFVVLSDLIWGGWAMSPNPEAFVKFFTAIFAGFKKAQSGLDLEGFANAAFARTQDIMRRNILRDRLPDQLRQSTYLTPVATIAAALREVPNETIKLIGQLLAEALHKAKEDPPAPAE
jgi:hypothetical protein